MGAVDLKRAQAAQDRLADAVATNPEVNGIGIARTPGKTVARNDQRGRAVDGMIEDARLRLPHPSAIRREDVRLPQRK